MTILAGPWTGPPIVQAAERKRRHDEERSREGYMEAAHRPRADPCPPICHACPFLKNPIGRYDVMSGCWEGSHMNAVESCTCDYDGPAISKMEGNG